MWKSSLFVLVSAFLLNDHLSSGDFRSFITDIELLPEEDLELDIDIIYYALKTPQFLLYEIGQLFQFTVCHLGYVTDFIEYITGWDGCHVPSHPMDCSEILKNGQNESGVYTIWPMNDVIGNGSIDVYCNMDIDGGGWTVILNRGNFSTQENFARDWNNYKNGFGDLRRDFWLGNDNIYAITNQKSYEIRFDLEDNYGNKAFAVYRTFWIEDETSMYKLHIENYITGNVIADGESEGNSMTYHNNMKFSTIKNNGNSSGGFSCSQLFGGGWWYNDCYRVLLTGEYLPGDNSSKAMKWTSWKEYGLSAADMKLRPA